MVIFACEYAIIFMSRSLKGHPFILKIISVSRNHDERRVRGVLIVYSIDYPHIKYDIKVLV